MQHVESLTEQWREMNSLFGNTEKLSKLRDDVRANKLLELFHSKCLKAFQHHYETFLNKSKEKNTDPTFKKAVAFESITRDCGSTYI